MCDTCPTGEYGENTFNCTACPDGFFCKDGGKKACALGRYGKTGISLIARSEQDSSCQDCPAGLYGHVEGAIQAKACAVCPVGRYNNQPGLSKTKNTRLEDYCPEGCPAGQYLDGKQCKICPKGGYCPGGTDIAGVKAMTGFWRVPNTTLFSPCLNPCACLGAVNPNLASQCPEETSTDHPESCNVDKGYREGGRLCADCLMGFSRDGRGTCKKCDEGGKVTVPVLAILALLAILCFLVWSTVIQRGGAFESSDGAKKVYLSYLQTAALSATMSIPWPADYIGLFRTQALVSSVGEELMDVRCMMAQTLSVAEVEYWKTLSYVLLPVGLVFITVVVWSTLGPRFVERKQVRPMMVGTIVLLLYLLYPSITASVFGLWKCEEVEGVGLIFVVDPETLCTDASHRWWVNFIGWPAVVVYVLGLPLAAFITLYRFRDKLDEPNTRIRFGLLYDGYKRAHYRHEFWVVLRKLAIIYIGIFSKELQVLLALGVVGVLLAHTVMAQPFETESLSRLEILLNSCCFLTLWVGGIFVVYPRCNDSGGPSTICKAAEAGVLLLNIFCLLVGLGTYIWLSYLESREQLQGTAKTVCAVMSSWRVFQPCCKKGMGIWLRASQAEWTVNPIEKSLELKEIQTAPNDQDGPETVALLQERNKALELRCVQQSKRNHALANRNQQLENEMACLRQRRVDPGMVVELRRLQMKNSADRKDRLGRLSALRKAASRAES